MVLTAQTHSRILQARGIDLASATQRPLVGIPLRGLPAVLVLWEVHGLWVSIGEANPQGHT